MGGSGGGLRELFSLTPLLSCDRTWFSAGRRVRRMGRAVRSLSDRRPSGRHGPPLAPCLLGKLTHGLLSALLAILVSLWLF